MSRVAVLFIASIAFLVSSAAFADVKVITIGNSISDAEKKEIEAQKKIMDEILKHYAEDALDRPKNLVACVREMFSAQRSGECRDKFTHYYSPKQAAQHDEEMGGSFGGVGIEITERDGSVVVIAPMADTPAARAGIESGDIIVKVDGKEPRSSNHAVKLLRGKPGTKVAVTILRNRTKKEIVFHLVRETIVIKSVKWRISLADKTVGIVEIRGFDTNLMDQFSGAIVSAVRAGAKKIVLDLRNNPGGLLNGSLALLALFARHNDTILTIRYRNNRETMTRSKMPFMAFMGFVRASLKLKNGIGVDNLRDLPAVVLVNNGSASASEIFSGTMKDWGYPVIGEKTFGKGVGQTIFRLSDGSMFALTTFEFLVGNRLGVIRDKGVIPTIVIKAAEKKPGAKYDEKNDRQLEKAIDILKNCAKDGPFQGYRCTR